MNAIGLIGGCMQVEAVKSEGEQKDEEQRVPMFRIVGRQEQQPTEPSSKVPTVPVSAMPSLWAQC